MPEELTRRARELAYATGGWTPPVARPASTVVLLRPATSERGVATYLMRRVPQMAFAAGMTVFPGGRVDDRDSDPAVPWAPPASYDAAAEAARMSADPALARALLVCAVREVFEETGVLLARADGGAAPAHGEGGPDEAWERDRLGVLDGSIPFAAVLRRRGLVVDPTLLPLWTHWITPEVEDRRYDVRFFVAALPAGQEAVDVGGEADLVSWWEPDEALRAYGAGALPMLPPTVATLADLAAMPDVPATLAAAPGRPVAPLLPTALPDGAGGVRWVLADARDGSVVAERDEPPAGSESRGTS